MFQGQQFFSERTYPRDLIGNKSGVVCGGGGGGGGSVYTVYCICIYAISACCVGLCFHNSTNQNTRKQLKGKLRHEQRFVRNVILVNVSIIGLNNQ